MMNGHFSVFMIHVRSFVTVCYIEEKLFTLQHVTDVSMGDAAIMNFGCGHIGDGCIEC